MTKPPGSPIDAEAPRLKSVEERNVSLSSNQVAGGMPYKTRLERFDEVFRTLLVIASVLTGVYMTSTPRTFLSGTFQWTLFLFAAIVIWSIAALWGKHPWANTARITSLQILSMHLLILVWALFVVIPPAVIIPIPFSESTALATILAAAVSAVIGILGGIYLRLRIREMGVAWLVLGVVMFLWSSIMRALYP